MTTQRPWLAQYPAGVPHQIDVDEFASIPAVLEQSIRQFGDRPAFTSMGKALTYAQVDELSRQFAAYLLGELKLKKGDRVVTQSGLVGRLLEVDTRYAKLELAPGVKVQVLRTSLLGRDGEDSAKSGDKVKVVNGVIQSNA